jgi:hypothetical protein
MFLKSAGLNAKTARNWKTQPAQTSKAQGFAAGTEKIIRFDFL